MTVEERLTRLETIIENQTKQINKLNNSVESLVEKFEQRIEINGKQDTSIATIKTKQEEHEKDIQQLGENIADLANEFRTDIKSLTKKVYTIFGILASVQGLIEIISRFAK